MLSGKKNVLKIELLALRVIVIYMGLVTIQEK
jgi:hypothetical protein